MHDILVALAFVAMVACPAIVYALPQREMDDDLEDAGSNAPVSARPASAL
jgi:hypothetical protein